MTSPHLNRSLVLESPSNVPDGAGGQTVLWVPLGQLWGAVKFASGSVRTAETSAQSRLNIDVFVRGAPDSSTLRPKPGQRFREGGRVYRIDTVGDWDARAHYLKCDCRLEVTP